MLLGPIFSAELVTTARRARYFVVRAVYAAMLLLILWSIYHRVVERSTLLSIRQLASLAHEFFTWFAYLQVIVVLLLGPAIAAGTIATERERRTIEYLFVSELTNREIVFDKLAARLLLILSLGLVGMPVIWIFRILGGIPAGLLLLSFLVTASTMVAVTAVSVSVSVWSPRARDAVMRAYLVLIAALVLPWIIFMVLSAGVVPGRLATTVVWVSDWCLVINPLRVLTRALGGVVGGPGGVFDGSEVRHLLVAHMAIAILSAVAAVVAVRRVHTRSVGGVPRRRWQFRLPRWRAGVGRYPMVWKELFAGGPARLGMAGRIALTLVILGVLASTVVAWTSSYSVASPNYPAVRTYAQYAAVMGTAVGCGIIVLVAARAAMSVAGEKERQTWDAVLATPLSARQIVVAKIVGSLYAMRWLFALLLILWCPAVVMTGGYVLAIPLVFGPLVVLIWYACALGVLFSLVCRSSAWAMAVTLAIGLWAGGGYLFTCCLPVLIMGSGGPNAVIFAPCVPFLLAVPGIGFTEVWFGADWREWEPIAAFLLGMIAYFFAAILLTVAAIANFDQLAGRVQLDWHNVARPPRRPTGEGPLVDS
jgi:ABC-type transport system involved in multi-copper enzyme maturation permease subunit